MKIDVQKLALESTVVLTNQKNKDLFDSSNHFRTLQNDKSFISFKETEFMSKNSRIPVFSTSNNFSIEMKNENKTNYITQQNNRQIKQKLNDCKVLLRPKIPPGYKINTDKRFGNSKPQYVFNYNTGFNSVEQSVDFSGPINLRIPMNDTAKT